MSNLLKEWEYISLKEVVDEIIDNRGRNPKSYSSFGIPVIDNFLIVGERKVDLKRAKRFLDNITYNTFIRKHVKENDLLITLVGNGYGNLALSPTEKSAIIQNTIGIRANGISNNIFLFYYFSLNKVLITNLDRGAAQPSVKVGDLLDIQIYLPPLPEQKSIANILSSFDEKIELLREQNETLETLAQTIFKEWFVHFRYPGSESEKLKVKSEKLMVDSEFGEIPKGWRVGQLSEQVNITMGQSPKGDSYNELSDGMVFYQGRAEFQSRFPKRRLHTTEPKRIAEKFDVLMSVRAPVGDINVATEECCIGRGLAAINSGHKSYALYQMKSLKKEFDTFESEGTVFGSINKKSLESIKVIIPPRDILDSYNSMAHALDDKIYKNFSQIQTLTKTRDILLPKLMSGEIRMNSEQLKVKNKA